MTQIDEQLDKEPTTKAIKELAELRIRNNLAFTELQTYNDTGKFRYKHPLIVHQSERAQLIDLLQRDPEEFLRRHRNVQDSIRRYESYLKRADRESRRIQDKEHLLRHRERGALFKAVLDIKHKET